MDKWGLVLRKTDTDTDLGTIVSYYTIQTRASVAIVTRVFILVS